MAYYYTHDGQRFGPVSSDELKALAAAAKICPQDAILCDADVQWKPAGELKELFQIDAKPTSSAPPLAQLVLPQVVPVSHLPLHVPLSPSTETILLPNRAVEYLRQSLQKVLPTLRLSVKRLFFEISKIATEAWFQTIRLVKYILWLIRGFSLARRARHSQLMLGEKLYRAGLGEDKVRAEIARIDNRIRNVQAANGSMRPLVTERRDFCIRLARSYPTKEIASAEVAQEYRDAKAAQNMVQSHQRERGCQRQALFPSTLLARLRVATGYGTIAILIFLLIPVIASCGSRLEPAHSHSSCTRMNSLDPVGHGINTTT